MRGLIGWLACGALLLACYNDHDPNLPPEEEVFMRSSEAPSCATACQRLSSLGCPESAPTPSGTTCITVCERNRSKLPIPCVSQARSVAEVRACGVRCED